MDLLIGQKLSALGPIFAFRRPKSDRHPKCVVRRPARVEEQRAPSGASHLTARMTVEVPDTWSDAAPPGLNPAIAQVRTTKQARRAADRAEFGGCNHSTGASSCLRAGVGHLLGPTMLMPTVAFLRRSTGAAMALMPDANTVSIMAWPRTCVDCRKPSRASPLLGPWGRSPLVRQSLGRPRTPSPVGRSSSTARQGRSGAGQARIHAWVGAQFLAPALGLGNPGQPVFIDEVQLPVMRLPQVQAPPPIHGAGAGRCRQRWCPGKASGSSPSRPESAPARRR